MSVAAKKELTAEAKERFIRAAAQLRGAAEVDAVIRAKICSDAPLIEEISRYLLELGGKRVRPLLTLMTARALGMATPSQSVIDVAAGIELIHMATLLHDDIIDRSPMRRHHSSPFSRYGAPNTLLAGDFLLTRAFSLCAHLDTYIIEATERACIDLTEGEILEASLKEASHTIESSLNIARKKTAALFRLACESGSHLAGCSTACRDDLAEFGEALGVAFQIVDDIIDVTSTEEELGKRPGTDIRERKPSLVNVLWRDTGSDLARTVLIESEGDVEDGRVEQALAEIRSGPVIEKAKEVARTFSARALAALERGFLTTQSINRDAYDGLVAIVDYSVERLG